MAMTLFGDLDVSTLRDAPPGRQAVHTYLATPEQRDQWWDFYCRKLREGGRVTSWCRSWKVRPTSPPRAWTRHTKRWPADRSKRSGWA